MTDIKTQIVIVANLEVPEEAYADCGNTPPVVVEKRNAEGDPMGVVAACPSEIAALEGHDLTACQAVAAPQMLAALKQINAALMTVFGHPSGAHATVGEAWESVRRAITVASYRVLEIEHMKSPRYAENEDAFYEKCDESANPCAICGKPVKTSRYWVHIVDGGGVVLHPDDEDKYSAAGEPSADCGCWPVGPDCLRKNPDLKPFVTDAKKAK